jgi:hypothetical protein
MPKVDFVYVFLRKFILFFVRIPFIFPIMFFCMTIQELQLSFRIVSLGFILSIHFLQQVKLFLCYYLIHCL